MSMSQAELGREIVIRYLRSVADELAARSEDRHRSGSAIGAAHLVERYRAVQLTADVLGGWGEELGTPLPDCVATVRAAHPDAPAGCCVCGAGQSGGEGESEAPEASDVTDDELVADMKDALSEGSGWISVEEGRLRRWVGAAEALAAQQETDRG